MEEVTNKNGGNFPRGTIKVPHEAAVLRFVRDTLVSIYGSDRNAAKVCAKDAERSPRNAQGWLAGDHGMSLYTAVALAHRVPEFRSAVRRLFALDSDLDPAMEHELQRLHQNITRILEERKAATE